MTQLTHPSSDLTIGVDLGDKSSEFCILGPGAQVLERGALATTPEAFQPFFDALPKAKVVFEVGGQSRWVQKLLATPEREVITADARDLPLITQSYKKSDRRDAEMLARIGSGMPELLTDVRHSSDDAHARVALVQARSKLVATRTALVVMIRSWVKTTGARISGCNPENFYSRAPQQIPEYLQLVCDPIFAILRSLHEQLRRIEKRIKQLSRSDAVIERLRSVFGVGPITAFAFAAVVENPERFKKNRDIGPYCGLVPRRSESGQQAPQLGITKAGNPLLRRMLVLCANHILRESSKDSALKRWGMAMSQRGGRAARKRAVVAVARKLAVTMLAIWKSGESYDPWRGSQRPEPAEALAS